MSNHFVSTFLFLALGSTALADTVDLTPAKDNTLFEHPTGAISNGMGEFLFTGRNAGGLEPAGTRRGLLEFDVAGAVPAGSTIDNVSLIMSMTKTISGGQLHELHRALLEWGEGPSDASGNEGGGTGALAPDATWLDAMRGTVAWASVGGDFDPATSASLVVGGLGVYTFVSTVQLVADVQDMLDNPVTNNGWILFGNESSNSTAKRWGSAQNPTSVFQPVLRIDFTPAVGAPAFCMGVGCPCGNDDPAAGCVNSTGSGASLSMTGGSTSIAADDLVLTASSFPPNNSGLYFMGANTFAPINVGDGLACTGGLFRFIPGTVSASGDFVKTNIASTAPIGQITPGDTRHFQAWTRDVLCGPPPVPCPSPCLNNSNLSNGISITFVP